jgi:hypothetical protein
MINILNAAIKNMDPKYFERKERDFSYELYHQIRLQKLPLDTEITCEHPKRRFSHSDTILEDPLVRRYFFADEIDESKKIFRYPDLLIHEFENRNQQLLAVEIKKQFNESQIKRDLAKLIVYCRGRLRYKNGVLIITQQANTRRIIEVRDIREMLRKYPEVEIWTVCPERIDVYNSITINNQNQ